MYGVSASLPTLDPPPKGIAPISDKQLKSIVDTCEVATHTRADAAAASALARQAKVDEKGRKDQEDFLQAGREAGRQYVAALKRSAAVGFAAGAASLLKLGAAADDKRVAAADNKRAAAADDEGVTTAGHKGVAAASDEHSSAAGAEGVAAVGEKGAAAAAEDGVDAAEAPLAAAATSTGHAAVGASMAEAETAFVKPYAVEVLTMDWATALKEYEDGIQSHTAQKLTDADGAAAAAAHAATALTAAARALAAGAVAERAAVEGVTASLLEGKRLAARRRPPPP